MQEIATNETMLSDAVRIEWLITNKFKRIATDSSGWSVLYIDPSDNRLWEKTYPNSEMHGGGPPKLTCLSVTDAQQKYGDLKYVVK